MKRTYLGPTVPGVVYVVLSRQTGLYKIGYSRDLKRRLNSVKRADPLAGDRLHNILLIPAEYPYHLEQQLHARFAERRVDREWFALSDADIDYLFRTYPPPSENSKASGSGKKPRRGTSLFGKF